MINRRKKQQEKEAAKKMEEAKLAEDKKLEEMKPVYTVKEGKNIIIREIVTSAGTESIAETVSVYTTIAVQLPKVTSAGDIDAEVVDESRFELEVLDVYWLEFDLPKKVQDDAMQCKWDATKKILTIKVPNLEQPPQLPPTPEVRLSLAADGTVGCSIQI